MSKAMLNVFKSSTFVCSLLLFTTSTSQAQQSPEQAPQQGLQEAPAPVQEEPKEAPQQAQELRAQAEADFKAQVENRRAALAAQNAAALKELAEVQQATIKALQEKIIADQQKRAQGLNPREAAANAKKMAELQARQAAILKALVQVRVAQPVAVPALPNMPPIDKATQIRIDGDLINEDPKDRVRSNSPHKVHVLSFSAKQRYIIDLMRRDTTGIDPYLRIEDLKGTQLALDDDGGQGLNSRIIFSPPRDGNYRIIATCLSGTGPYALQVTMFQHPKVVKAVKQGPPVKIGAQAIAMKGNLNQQSPKDQGKPSQTFPIKLEAGKTYSIAMNSNDFDCYLRLRDENGKLLASNDDGGPGLNSLLTFRPPNNGTYRIVATRFGGGLGNFEITVQANK